MSEIVKRREDERGDGVSEIGGVEIKPNIFV
jgi:hypothetical protein